MGGNSSEQVHQDNPEKVRSIGLQLILANCSSEVGHVNRTNAHSAYQVENSLVIWSVPGK